MAAVEESCVQLQYLNLSNNSLSADLKNEHSITFCKKLMMLIDVSDKLVHLNLSSMCLQSRVTIMMWSIMRSKSLQGVHLSNNEIPKSVLRTILFAFGIPDANEGDLFDNANHAQIERYKNHSRKIDKDYA